jgi:uncharacterized membrane protein YuzA (DUF378 family)
MNNNKGTIDWIAYILVIIGAINWGLAIWDLNIVSLILGVGLIANIVYALVGLSGIWVLYKLFL